MALVLLLAPGASFAHEYQSDGPIRVLLHVDPDDTPPAKDPAQLEFSVFDSQNQFVGSHCDCFVRVSGNGSNLINKRILNDQKANKDIALVPIVFPNPGEYTVSLSGQPKAGYSFHPFNLSYSVRVTKQQGGVAVTANNSAIINTAKVVGVYALATVAIIAIILVGERRWRKKRR